MGADGDCTFQSDYGKLGDPYLMPVVEHMRKQLLSRHIIHCDETPVQVLKEEGKKPQTKSYM